MNKIIENKTENTQQYERLQLIDLYHWELDQQGNIIIKPNQMSET